MIKTLIFDWGGVLTVGKHTSSIIRILEMKYNLKNICSFIDRLTILIDSGEITFEKYCNDLNNEFGTNISVDEMKDIFQKAIIPNHEMIDLVKKLKVCYKIILLSNNNQPTIDILKNEHKQMLDLFEKTYFSAELKMRKPSKNLFDLVLKDSDLNPNESIFIDDKEKNIMASEKIGIKGILFSGIKNLEKELAEYGINVV